MARLATLSSDFEEWRANIAGCIDRMILCFGYLTVTESLNWDPAVDFKVWMDMQFRHAATDPSLRGLYGLMEYLSSYADEETVRWVARLYRHYGIEGRTDLLSDEGGFRYHAGHIENADFARALNGWTVDAASEGSISSRWMHRYSWLQGRYPRTVMGDSFLCMRRDSARPNTVSQPIRRLSPGRLYSLKCIVADYGDLRDGRSVEKTPSISLGIDGGEILPEKTICSTVPNNYAHTVGPFTTDHPAWLTHHRIVFRATTETGRLSISDWLTAHRPGGPSGQESMLNFVELQPYWSGT